MDKIILNVGDEVYLIDDQKWKIVSFDWKHTFVKVRRRKEERTINFNKLRTISSEKLLPHSEYELSLGYEYDYKYWKEYKKYAVVLTKVKGIDERVIRIVGANQTRKIRNKPLNEFNFEITCESANPFDELPEIVVIRKGDKVQVREDAGALYNSHGWPEVVSKSGKEGTVISIQKGWSMMWEKNTLSVKFGSSIKEYLVHRFIDSNGNSMCYGWHYKVSREDDTFTAIPERKNKEGALSWRE